MDEKQFNQLLEALNGLSTKIDQHFSLKPAIEAEKTVEKVDESQPQKYATVEQLDEIKSVMTELTQKFNQLLQPVTDIPTGEPVQSEKFNVGAM